MFYDNYARLCNAVHKTPSAVALEIGIAKPTVSRWKSGSKPNRATLLKIADYFKISVEELTGEKEEPADQLADGLTEEEIEYIKWYRHAPENAKEAVRLIIKGSKRNDK